MLCKKLAILVVLLALMGTSVAAAKPTIMVMNNDGNYYYPAGSTVVIKFVMADADTNPTDVNVQISYVRVTNAAGEAIIWAKNGNQLAAAVRTATKPDYNSMNFCTKPLTDVNQLCTYSWTLPSGLDGNFVFDINARDNTTGDDVNALNYGYATGAGSTNVGDFTIDTNACLSEAKYSQSTSSVTMTTACAGYGSTATIHYDSTRIGICPDSLNATYESPVHFVFGDFTLCYSSTDNLGNIETWRSLQFKASSNAYDLAVLVEMLMAALIIMAALGAVVLRHEEMSGALMIGLVATAVIIAIAILIFATIL